MLLARASWWLLAFHPTPLCSPLGSFPSVVHSLNCILESHTWTHHRKAHCEGKQLPNLLLLGEKWVRCGFSWTQTHRSPLDDYRFHWWHLQLIDLTWPWPNQLPKESRKVVRGRPSMTLKWSVLPQNLGGSLQHKHALARTGA